jgi:AcrR family transcriptional regulator
MKAPKLTAELWIEAAFRALTAGGPQAIKAEAIARDLQVSKGSFYWHFVDVPDLKRQMLLLWQQKATANIIAMLENNADPAADRLRSLVEFATSGDDVRYGGVLAETAIRNWAQYDAAACATVEAVDLQRLKFLDSQFAQCGAEAGQIRTNSAILYGALLGIGSLSHSGFADLKHDLHCLLEKLLDTI